MCGKAVILTNRYGRPVNASAVWRGTVAPRRSVPQHPPHHCARETARQQKPALASPLFGIAGWHAKAALPHSTGALQLGGLQLRQRLGNGICADALVLQLLPQGGQLISSNQ